MWIKKTFSDSVLCIALLSSLFRTNYDLDRDPGHGHSYEQGDDTIVLLQNLRNTLPYDYPSSKTNILWQETLDVLRDLNSLGRYSRHSHCNTSLFAYLVNGDDGPANLLNTVPVPSSSRSSSSERTSTSTSSLSVPSPSTLSDASLDHEQYLHQVIQLIISII